MILQLSQFFTLCSMQPSTLHSLWQSSHHCSHSRVMGIDSLAPLFPMLYFTSPWLFCNFLFVLLNALTYSPIPTHPLAFSNQKRGGKKTTLHIHDSVSALLVCLVCFLDSIVDMYFCHFIIHRFDILLK